MIEAVVEVLTPPEFEVVFCLLLFATEYWRNLGWVMPLVVDEVCALVLVTACLRFEWLDTLLMLLCWLRLSVDCCFEPVFCFCCIWSRVDFFSCCDGCGWWF